MKDIECSGTDALIFESSAPKSEFEKWWNSLAHLPFDSPKWFSPPDEWIHGLRADTDALHREVCQYLQSKSPDLVLYDQFFYPGNVISRRLGCQRVRLSGHFAKFEKLLLWRNGACVNSEPALEWARRIDNFLSEQGIDTDGSIWQTEALNIHFVPDAFQYYRSYFDDRFCFAGRSMSRSFPRKWIDKNGINPVILISGLSGISGVHESPSYYRLILEALGDSAFHCVLLGERAASHYWPLPNNFEICRDGSPLEILPHAALLICHGGMGSTLEAIYHGVPVLALPSHPGADEVAYRVTELGLGVRMLREEATAKCIREAVATMLGDKSLRERVKHMQNEFEHSIAIPRATDRIERLLEAV